MRRFALLAAGVAALLSASGCARWTLRPLHKPAAARAEQTPDQLGNLSALMQSQAGPAATMAPDPAATPTPEQGLDNLPPDLAIARLSERQGDESQSRALYQAFIAKNPRHPLPHHRLGVMAARQARLDEAEQHLRTALEVSPPSVELLGDMGYLCYLQSRFDEAEHFLLQALEQAPDNKSATNNLALVYGARGDFDKSLSYFRRVNDDARSHANVAFAMTQQGRLEDARNEYLHALTIDKSLRSAATALAQIEETRRAAKLAAKRNDAAPEGAPQRDDVIELSSASPAPNRERYAAEYSAPRQAYSEPRAQQPAAAPAQREVASRNAYSGSSADRLMPLPALPATDAQAPQHAMNLPPRSENSPVAYAPQQRPAVSPPSQQSDIFAQARQVSWDAGSLRPSPDTASRTYNSIPIPTSEPRYSQAPRGETLHSAPIGDAPQRMMPALAMQPSDSFSSPVKPATHWGLSDEGQKSPSVSPPSGRASQFSDFNAAPARLNTTATLAPLGSQR